MQSYIMSKKSMNERIDVAGIIVADTHQEAGGEILGCRHQNPARSTIGLRKGPWMPEEDAVLLDYVKNHGPQDWSSLQSNGLLPRSGKSCRLRWVNKLKPGLKTGCKLSAEEERVVVELQQRFGNKWAQIATHLPGRTDNDVKNFWSTRQKRLARLLQIPPVAAEFPTLEHNLNSTATTPCSELIPYSETSSNSHCSHASSAEKVSTLKLDASLPHLEPSNSDREPFDHSLLDLSLIPEDQDLISEFDDLICHPAFFNLDIWGHDGEIRHPEALPESFFDDFPTDIFGCLEPPPAAAAPRPPGYR